MIGQHLELKNTQKLILSQALRQSLKILQMPVMELKEHLEEELEQNPMLEQKEAEEKKDKENESPTLEEWNEYLPRDEVNAGERDRSPEKYTEEKARPAYSLEERLIWQLRLSATNEEDYRIGEKLIGNINDDGYFTADLAELCAADSIKTEDAERVLALIQTFEPTGVGARNLRECLLIQLTSTGLTGTLAWKIVSEAWEDFEKGHFEAAAAKLSATQEEVNQAVKLISKLEPKPGREFSSDEVRYIVPDVLIERETDGSWRVMLNNQGMPSIRINSVYQRALKDGSVKPDEKKFLEDKFRAAVAVIRSIEERKKTLIKVTRSIVERQNEFLEKGIEYLKPLTLREVSEEIGMHESTVSRVTANKYIQTPVGTFAFRHFFNVSLDRNEGGTVSSASVKDMIKGMIAGEAANDPLTDGTIAAILGGKGIKLSRRTVAKYREEMKILPAGSRHRI